MIESICIRCGARFKTFKSAILRGRKYCTYPCFVESGGTIRAGLAAAKMRRTYGHRKDANQKEITDLLYKFRIPYVDTSMVGCGFPDLIVVVGGVNFLWEVKNKKTSYGRRGLNKNQLAWATGWKTPIYVVRSVIDAEKFLRGDRTIESYGGDQPLTKEQVSAITDLKQSWIDKRRSAYAL